MNKNKEKVGWTTEEKNFFNKIFWRIKFLLLESWGKNWDAVLCSLNPARLRGGEKLAELLDKRKIIKWNKENEYIKYNDKIFYYKGVPPVLDLMDIYMSEIKYIKRNFLKNSAYNLGGVYEKDQVVLNEGDYVIDAGANFGLFAVLAGDKVGSGGKVYAFEPIRESKDLLSRTINSNNLNNIEIISKALGARNDQVEFTVFGGLEESSGYFSGDYPKVKVDQVTLDTFVENKEIKKVDFIKADIEGMERDLLKGAEKTIKKYKPKISICTYHRPDDPEVLERIIKSFDNNYKIFKTDSKLHAWV